MDLRKLIKNKKQKMIVGALAFLFLILILIAIYFLFIKRKIEVYYADKGGTNTTRYQFASKEAAENYAKSLGGTLATVDQLRKANESQGMDICWNGWASDGLIYTVSNRSHGDGSGCESGNHTIGVTIQRNAFIAGAWVYGVKPRSYTNCTDYNITTPCIIHT